MDNAVVGAWRGRRRNPHEREVAKPYLCCPRGAETELWEESAPVPVVVVGSTTGLIDVRSLPIELLRPCAGDLFRKGRS
jgi:hypothetical protein